jgi:hypothetical protein
MSPFHRRSIAIVCTLVLLTLAGCRRAPENWSPVLEETSTTTLRTQTEAVAERVRSAAGRLASDPAAAAADLVAAEEGLDHLLAYYLPLVEARELAYNAYRHLSLAEPGQTRRELDQVEAILMAIAEADSGRLLGEMEQALDRVEDAKTALGVDDDEASKALQALATRLNFLVVKGGLVLAE